MMNDTTQATSASLEWLARLENARGAAPTTALLPPEPAVAAAALAALAAESLARDRRLLVITADDNLLAEISNALDLSLRPLCLVLPGADYASRITLRATISLLKSRLSRDGDDSQGPVWRKQRACIHDHAETWHAAQAWCARSGDRDSWPDAIAPLFPARFAPADFARRLLGDDAEWVVAIGSAASALPDAWPGARALLHLRDTLAPPSAMVPVDEHVRLRIELDLITNQLGELELELVTAQAEMGAFNERYHRLVGRRMTELDSMQAEVARRSAEAEPANPRRQQEAIEAAEQAARSREESLRHEAAGQGADQERAAADRVASDEFRPEVDVKKLYRQIAQKIHPDRAQDEADRAWRTELMAEANRAYRAGDGMALREILAAWMDNMGPTQCRPSDGNASDDRAARSALARQVMRLRRRAAEIEAELNQLYASRLYELFAATKVARRQGRDLLEEMAERLDSQISLIRMALDGRD